MGIGLAFPALLAFSFTFVSVEVNAFVALLSLSSAPSNILLPLTLSPVSGGSFSFALATSETSPAFLALALSFACWLAASDSAAIEAVRCPNVCVVVLCPKDVLKFGQEAFFSGLIILQPISVLTIQFAVVKYTE